METALVVAILAAAVLYLARRFLFARKKRPLSGCDGCSGCGGALTRKDAKPCAEPREDPDDESLS